jgi:hypothetical protein
MKAGFDPESKNGLASSFESKIPLDAATQPTPRKVRVRTSSYLQ